LASLDCGPPERFGYRGLQSQKGHVDSGTSLESEPEEIRRQINWELDAIERSDLMAFYFAPGTKSPISLLELGLIARQKQAIVCCPPGFWRKTNVDVVCERFGIAQVDSLEGLVNEIKERVRLFRRTEEREVTSI
jgi:hypothetical protein